MAKDDSHPQTPGFRRCRTLLSYPIIRPTYTTFCMKNFLNQVDFHSNEKLPCKNTWYRDLKSTHIRNKRLLDLPFKAPKCCTNIYNVVLDRQKLKKVQNYGLTRSVRTLISNLDIEEAEPCVAEASPCNEEKTKPCQPTEEANNTSVTEVVEKAKIVVFPECYQVPESESEDEEEDEYEFCASGSVSECSGCSTIGGGIRRRKHKVEKKHWKDLLHVPEAELCKSSVDDEIRKHKMGYNLTLKLKKVF